MKKRAFITMRLAVDLDMVPGWGHQPEDWVNTIKYHLGPETGSYRPELVEVSTEIKPYGWVDGEGWVKPSHDEKAT